jgi:hypothetical protein
MYFFLNIYKIYFLELLNQKIRIHLSKSIFFSLNTRKKHRIYEIQFLIIFQAFPCLNLYFLE